MNKQGLTLGSLIKDLPRPSEEHEFRLKILAEEFGEYGKNVLLQLGEKISSEADWTPEQPNYEGIRVQCKGEGEDGWFLLRMSLHDPVMPLNVESNMKGGISIIRKRLIMLLNSFDKLNIDALIS